MDTVTREPIAIVGVGCVLPDAPDVETFWNNLQQGLDSIREVPANRWDPTLYYDPDRSAPDRTYTKIGGFVTDDAFDGLAYRMPPKVQQQVDRSQQWALSAARQALLDAGLRTGIRGDDGRDFDRDRTAVIIGNAMGGESNKIAAKRLFWPEARAAIQADEAFQTLPADVQASILQRAEERYKANTVPVTEDTMPGHLSNVVAGRIANVFDLTGKNFTTDAACASSLAALDAAVDALRDDECDVVLWGGTDRSMDITPYIEFSKIGALSPDGSRPFDAAANGFVMGEGCAMFVLKRLRDAERDGDRVHAVVRGVGSSSDGKGKGITAPNPTGQVNAVLRAFREAEMDPYTVGYLEAHGTSTPVGDPVELTSVREAFQQIRPNDVPPGSIRVGSVKSNIGHLKAAAGAAGVLKAVLALEHGVIPPSINVETLNPAIEWETSPFQVATARMDWPRPDGHPRRAAVSSFGFGGTNFHVVLEEYVPGALQYVDPRAAVTVRPADAAPAATAATPGTAPRTAATGPVTETVFDADGFRAHMESAAVLEQTPLVLDGERLPGSLAALPAAITFPETGEGPRARDAFYDLTRAGLAAERRLGIAPVDLEDVQKKLALARKAAADPAAARLAFNQGVFLNQGGPAGKVAFLFPGQGTQYVNMGRDLAQKYAVVRHTFREADEVLFDELDGVKLTDILWPTPDTAENRIASEEKLKLTEFTQPAVLAMDVALLRLLKQWGIQADVVAGHSLGEYGALVAAGVLSFADALHAVAARGREMANVDLPDLGKMASIPADWETVSAAIGTIDEYVICANKNCPSQTVIAGSSAGVDAAVRALTEQGLQCTYLPVSAAFHSDIVAPASEPLRRVLGRLDVQAPKTRILSNVGAEPYGDDPDAIRDNLAVQVASPVEWIGIVERMYDEGVRTFIEVGPKKALTGFAFDILKEKGDAVAVPANHPKKGGIQHVNELFAFLGAWGLRPRLPDLADAAVYTAEFRDPRAAFTTTTRSAAGAPAPAPAPVADPRIDAIAGALRDLARTLDGMDGRPQQVSTSTAPVGMHVPERRQPAATGAAPATTPVSANTPATDADRLLAAKARAFGINLDDVGFSGISVGLPGAHKPLFADDDWDRILRGDNLIDALPDGERLKIADKNIVRLVKRGDGQATFQVIDDVAQVIQLAGQRGDFDVTQWGVDADFASTLDRTFQYAIAAGLEALRDAGIPLQRTYLQTTTGSHLPKEWKLPEPLRDETGIVFASAFPGYDNLVRDVSRYLADKYAGSTRDDLQRLYQDLVDAVQDPELKERVQGTFDAEFERLANVLPEQTETRYEFNRKFLFNVLSLGHAQLAQFIGARGPNTQVNAACASTTQAIAVAEDWIRTGRCKRVLVVGADDVTSDALFEWIGSGFLASGAATTKATVEEAALPFDARRHGMIVGMGAVGLVLETVPETEARGMRPIARLLATEVANSAFHGSRLDVDHISACMTALVAKAQARYGIDAAGIAAQTVFMSHETYTPARGGSASAEIHALRKTFGDQANKVVIANTKGFTGHPQGAGVEDAIVLKALQRGTIPPIANFRDPDPELGDLNLSRGGHYDVRYAVRLAAGFGSQIAMSLTELVAREDERFADEATYKAWLSTVSGLPGAETEVVNRTLRIVDQGAPKKAVAEPVPAAPAPVAAAPTTAPADTGAVLEKVTALVAQKTGYPPEMLEADLDMEADLGIDTVKQAELFGELRGTFGVPLKEDLQLKDFNTLRKVASYMAGGTGSSTPAPTPATPATSSPAAPAAPTTAPDAVLEQVVAVVAEKTGYPAEMLEPDLDMEADLGIDTVKQAELFGELRETFGVPLKEDLQLKDFNTLRKVASYMSGGTAAAPATPAAPAPEPAAEATPAPATAPEASDEVLATVTAVVAEKTGYPPEMLEADLDLESDLGIDTVKQAELFGELRERFGVPMREDLSLADYNTLRKVADYMSGGTAAAPATPAAPAPVPAAEATPAPATSATTPAASEDILQQVIAVVAEKTGYPAEMLEPELDMEADLGIDTVKQAELFGELRERFGVPMREDLSLADYNTLAKVAAYMRASRPQTAVASDSASSAPVTETPATEAPSHPIVRRVPTLRPAALPDEANDLPKGTVLVVGDADTAFLDAWKEVGWTPTFRLREDDAPVGMLVLATRRGETAPARVGPLFDAAKSHREALAGGFVVVVTRQDGAHGLDAPRDAGMAAVAGLGKALRKEFPDAVVKVVDCHPDLDDAPATVVREATDGGARTEVAYSADGTRYLVDVAPEPLDGTPYVEGKTLVVPGGAQGITVELLAALAPQHPNLLLLGRTTVPEEAVTWAAWTDDEWKTAEQQQMERMREAGEKVTPVSIQKAMSPLRKAADVQRNLQRLTDLGAEVVYSAVDVTDADAVREAVAHARDRFGAIDGIIHAAGVEVSKDLSSKDRDQFDWVFGIKHDGLQALLAATEGDDLEWLAAFGSVAGRFGNIGQTDYSAANEFLCKAVKQAAAERGIPTAFTVAWGPWGEVGMATKGSILAIMEATGVTPIPTADGVRHFLAELATPGVRESVVAGNLGAIDVDGQVVETAWDPRVGRHEARIAAEPHRFALLDGVEAAGDGTVTTRLVLDKATQPYARDHAIDGVPYLPGVFGLEAFAETASLLAPDDAVCLGARDVRFGVPVKQLKDRPVVARIEATRTSAEEEPEQTVACRLTTRMVGPDGLERGDPRVHFEATLRFGDAPPVKRTNEVPGCTRDRDTASIYPPFFHGPSFQVLRYAGPLDEESVGVAVTPEAPVLDGVNPEWRLHPLLVEALFQVCGLRTMEVEGVMSLPAAIERVDVLHVGTYEDQPRLWSRFAGTDDDGLRRFDAAACTEDGTVLVRMVQYGMVATGPAPGAVASESEDAGSGPEPEPEPQTESTNGKNGNGTDARPEPSVEFTEKARPVQQTLASAVPIPTVDLGLPDDTGVLFAAVPVEEADPDPQWFTERELATAEGFAADKRAAEWRAGRLAAKAAAQAAGGDCTALDVTVQNDEGGKPRLILRGEPANYELSLTHRDGLAIAALAPAALGIDLETVEERSAAWREEAFNDAEAPVAEDDTAAACMWAAKEAVFKRIGTGLRSPLRAWTVRSDGRGGATVEGPDGTFGVRFWDVEGRVLAVSQPGYDPVTAETNA